MNGFQQNQVVDILLAEDSPIDVMMTREAFEDQKMVNILDVVNDGEAVLAYLRKEDPYSNRRMPGLVILDINMPKKSGLDVLSEMKKDNNLKHIPVVMLTTSVREEDIVKSYSDGACSFVSKPIKFEAFADVLEKFGLYWAVVVKIPGKRSGA